MNIRRDQTIFQSPENGMCRALIWDQKHLNRWTMPRNSFCWHNCPWSRSQANSLKGTTLTTTVLSKEINRNWKTSRSTEKSLKLANRLELRRSKLKSKLKMKMKFLRSLESHLSVLIWWTQSNLRTSLMKARLSDAALSLERTFVLKSAILAMVAGPITTFRLRSKLGNTGLQRWSLVRSIMRLRMYGLSPAWSLKWPLVTFYSSLAKETSTVRTMTILLKWWSS